jgi:hypothetical protein
MSNEQFFTDVVKDVIGNDPVVDQFDTYYEASFYGTMQDDFVTGSIISEIISDYTKSKSGGKDRIFVTGSRGKLFSKYYAESFPALNSTYGSDAVRLVPSLAYRLVPWHEKTSTTAYRINQHFDPNERYYDSCLPNISECLGLEGSRVWTSQNSEHSVLSPYGSVVTGSAGYLIFNSIPQDRTQDGYDTDPTLNNDWTWSFPFEAKYKPGNRFVGFDKSLGLKANLSARLPLYDKREREFKSFDSSTNDSDTTPVELVELNKVLKVENFFPLLPGYNENVRNSLRTKSNIEGALGTGKIRPGWYGPETGEEWSYKRVADKSYGYSLLVPGDVNLSKFSDREFLSTYVNAEAGSMLLTQSMGTDDNIKFLFGFGDVNNVTYGKRSFDSTKYISSYKLDLEDIADGTKPHQFSAYDSDGLKVNWSFNPYNLSDSNYHNVWCVASKQATAGGYNIVSGSSITSSIGWIPSTGGNKVIVSNTSVDYNGTMDNSGDALSIIIVDITSSYPWNFSYDRAIAGQKDYGSFATYFAAYPGQTSHVLAANGGKPGLGQLSIPNNYIDYLEPNIIDAPFDTFVTMSLYDFKEKYYQSQGDGAYPASPLGDYILDAGEYRLVFQYNFTDAPITEPQSAALDNFEIFTYREESFPVISNSRIGGNNYPKFKGYRTDDRLNPILSGTSAFNSEYLISGSAATSKSVVFGVSPEIRGWKYGLYSGLPSNSKAIFRRDKYGQFRDMLEQRPYTKFVNVNSSVVDDDAMTNNNFDNQTESKLTILKQITSTGPAVAEVNFVRQRYKKDERGIGYIYNEKVDPRLTISQNMSPEVTSSLPYFDGDAKLRQEEDLLLITDATLTSLQFGPGGLTVT